MALLPPVPMEIAQAQESVYAWLPAPSAAEVKMISRNITLVGTDDEQKAFELTFTEIRGIAQRAAGKSASVVEQAKLEVIKAVDTRILSNPAYDPFKTGTARGNDPLTE